MVLDKALNSRLRSGVILVAAFALVVACHKPGPPGDRGASAPHPVASPARVEARQLVDRLLDPAGGVLVIAHRACWRQAPENSIEAIEACVRSGIDMVEIDVRRTRDGHLVVIHDDTVDRTTNGVGSVSELTLAEVSALRLRSGMGGEGSTLTESRVPTLEQALASAMGNILVNLDAKDDVRSEAYATAAKMGMADQILIKMAMVSPDDVDLAATKFFGNTHFMPIVRQTNGSLEQQVQRFAGIEKVAFEVIYADELQLKAACRAAAAQATRCWVNTMWENLSPGHSDDVSVQDPDAHWGQLVRLGVNMMQTDRPVALIAFLQSRGYRQ
jgi:glycerophosphoryl diester phosphodiesterase